ncbi:MAG TPA: hypothetical protein PLF01_01510 [Alphaproteobacteria bacterium]|nr:hypothetical protein [Alphaproteobacteria bacterium]
MITFILPASAQAVCYTSKPTINVDIKIDKTKYDYTYTAEEITRRYNRSSGNSSKQVAFGLYNDNFTLFTGPLNYIVKEKKYSQSHDSCVKLNDMSVTISLKPVIYVSKQAFENDGDDCFKDIKKHEEGHDAVARGLILKYKKIARDAILKELSVRTRSELAKSNDIRETKRAYNQVIVQAYKKITDQYVQEAEKAQAKYHATESGGTSICGFLLWSAKQGFSDTPSENR